MKRIILAFLLCLFAAPAFAVCPANLQLKDNAGVTPPAKFTDDGANNCLPNIALWQWAGTNLGAPSTYGTSPGAVVVPGVNAFITNTPAVTVSGVSTAANQTLQIAQETATATALGVLGTTPCASPTTSCALIPIMQGVWTDIRNPMPAQATHTVNIGAVDSINQYPGTAVPYTASATGTTAATTATLAGAASVTTYICGFSIRANATAAATGNATVTGTITGTLNFTQWTAPNASGIGIAEMIFNPCVPASTTNTSIAVVSAAPGTGGVVSVTAWGYKL